MTTYRDSSRFQKGVMENDTGMDPENALTAIEPEETRRSSLALATSATSAAAGKYKKERG